MPSDDPARGVRSGAQWHLDAARARELLDVLDVRLRARGVAASVYVVGGVAVALSVRQDRSPSLDLDAIASDRAVFDEADAIAAERGLPPHWLNDAAQPWLPPRPPDALQPRVGPGLDVHIAPTEHLLAMKIVAFRDRDVDDIVDLVRALDLEAASAEQLATLVAGVYETSERLALAIGGPDEDADQELRFTCERTSRLLAVRRRSVGPGSDLTGRSPRL